MKNVSTLFLVFCAVFLPLLLPAQPKTKSTQTKTVKPLSNPANFGGCALIRDRLFEEDEFFGPAPEKVLPDSLINRPFGGAPLLPGDKTRQLLDNSRELEKRQRKSPKKKD